LQQQLWFNKNTKMGLTNGTKKMICMLIICFACFSEIDAGDREILMELFDSTRGQHWIKSKNWGTEEPICSWHGITCASTKDSSAEADSIPSEDAQSNDVSSMGQASASKIIKINLAKNNLTGRIPESIGDLDQLKHLNLRENNLRGPIPDSIAKLPLTVLDLSRNKIRGKFPEPILSLSQLKNLTLAVNQLEGSLPAAISNLQHLELLDLGSNKFQGEIPESFKEFKNLKILSLKKNNLTSIPDLWPKRTLNIPKLEILDLQHNNISGILPPGISEHRNLKIIRVNNNRFEGRFPPLPVTLKELDISNNKYKGNLPQYIKNAPGLQFLDISNNRFSGKFPEQIVKLEQLVKFTATNNKLSGTILSDFKRWTKLKTFDVGNNRLTGIVPKFLQNIEKCNLAGNAMDCTISTEELKKHCNITCATQKQLNE